MHKRTNGFQWTDRHTLDRAAPCLSRVLKKVKFYSHLTDFEMFS